MLLSAEEGTQVAHEERVGNPRSQAADPPEVSSASATPAGSLVLTLSGLLPSNSQPQRLKAPSPDQSPAPPQSSLWAEG